ncbi:MAG: diaminopimelate decarboxylase [Planctomycetes bacterium]|nr:diaminopimelate decarboxylase [Planctomycetota bacterium]
MDYFAYVRGRLHCEDVSVDALAAEYGTPLYVYSARTIIDHTRKLARAFAPAGDPILCYSVKANSNLSILKLMRDEGAGFDVVSGGELHRVLSIGADPRRVVFAGVGKTDEELRTALERDILLFNIESEEEMENLDRIAGGMNRVAEAALRVNPDVDPHTHVYVATGKKETKFGVDLERARRVLARAGRLRNVRMSGLHVHIGSQITRVEPYVQTLQRLARFLPEARAMGHPIEWLDLGGGFGIWYKEKLARSAQEIADAVMPSILAMKVRLLLEPGRFIVGNAGVLVTRVLYVKESGKRRFVVCDAGMADLIRPSLYGAYHRIWPVTTDPAHGGEAPDEEQWRGPTVISDVVGPICESGDFFAKERKLPPVRRGDLLSIFSAGAYGYAMASNYNSHPRPAEVMVAGRQAKIVTRRETVEDLVRLERVESFDVDPGAAAQGPG